MPCHYETEFKRVMDIGIDLAEGVAAATEGRALLRTPPRAPMQPCKRRVRLPAGSPPTPGPVPPEQAQSEKSQGVRGTESPDSFDNTLKKTENNVSVFPGELQPQVQ